MKKKMKLIARRPGLPRCVLHYGGNVVYAHQHLPANAKARACARAVTISGPPTSVDPRFM
jgi:hypothetical protein